MNALYQELVERIRTEMPELDQVARRVQHAWSQIQQVGSDERAVYLDSAALNLHGFYSGLERLFELIARHVDHSPPSGETWHRDLLHKMATVVQDVRPAVIGEQSARILDEFRRFRHLVRTVYTINFDPEKIGALVSPLSGLQSQLKAELLAFADFLEEVGWVDQE